MLEQKKRKREGMGREDREEMMERGGPGGRMDGGFGPGAGFPTQNDEGHSVAMSKPDRMAPGEALTDASLNARKTSPFGPAWPGLEEYFKDKG